MFKQLDESQTCDQEIADHIAYMMAGGPDEVGCYVGLTDWQEEKRLLNDHKST